MLLCLVLVFDGDDETRAKVERCVVGYIYYALHKDASENTSELHKMWSRLKDIFSMDELKEELKEVLADNGGIFSAAFNVKRCMQDGCTTAEAACSILLSLYKEGPETEADRKLKNALNQEALSVLVRSVLTITKGSADAEKFTETEKGFILKSRDVICAYVNEDTVLKMNQNIIIMMLNTSYESIVSIEKADRQFFTVFERFQNIPENNVKLVLHFMFNALQNCEFDFIRPSIGRYFRAMTTSCKNNKHNNNNTKFFSYSAYFLKLFRPNLCIPKRFTKELQGVPCITRTTLPFSLLSWPLSQRVLPTYRLHTTSLSFQTSKVPQSQSLKTLLCRATQQETS